MRVYIIVLLMALPIGLMAQTIGRQVIGATGGAAQTPSLQISSTVGEVAVTTASSGTLVLTQGFQQPDENTSVGIEPLEVTVGYDVFPNPTTDTWTLSFQSQVVQSLDIRLLDMQGRQVEGYSMRMQVNPSATRTWDVRQLASGTYILRVQTTDGRYQASIKLQKQS